MEKKRTGRRGLSLILALAVMITTIFCVQVPANAATIHSTRVTAAVQASGNIALRIRWNKVSSAQGYVIYRRESVKKSWKRLRVVNRNTSSYLDRNLISGKPYQYAVRAYRKENGKYVYSMYTPVIGATRPLKTKVSVKAVSGNRVNVTWTRVTRCDGYYVYRRGAGEKWKRIATVSRTTRSLADTTVSGNTLYRYCIRAYKRGGSVNYLAPMAESRVIRTPVVSSGDFQEVMKKILYAVETGGQVYGNQVYNDVTEAYTNSGAEHAITIGAGQWYGTEAQRLLKMIHDKYPSIWSRYDGQYNNIKKNLLWNDVVNKNWSTYKLTQSSYYKQTGKPKTTDDWKIYRIKLLIGCSAGRKCQDQLMYEQIREYEKEIRSIKGMASLDSQSVGMLINVRHQGGSDAVTRILNKTKKPVTLDNIYAALKTDTGNQVGAYRTRQERVYTWLKTYMK